MADFVVHEVQQPISVKVMDFATGTWAYSANSGNPYFAKTAADTTSIITIPIHLPFISGEHGVKLKAIKIPMRIGTADLDAVIAGTLYRTNYYKAVAAAGTDQDATTVTITETGTQVTFAATDRLYTATVASPDWVYTSTINNVSYHLSISLNAGATTVPRIYDAIAVYDTYL